MPKILNPGLYNLFSAATRTFLRDSPSVVRASETRLESDSIVYRYVGYRNMIGQPEAAGRTVWAPLSKDINNRWTGLGSDGGGSQGLYCSVDGPGGSLSVFAELKHYLDSTVPPSTKIAYFDNRPGQAPVWQQALAADLRSMFVFTTRKELPGFDLTFRGDNNNAVDHIFALAQEMEPGTIPPGVTAESLYFSSEDVSFTRAIGNVVLLTGPYDYIWTTSVRDRSAHNIVIAGQHGVPMPDLRAQGRMTFYIDGNTKTATGCLTVDDVIYSQELNTGGAGVVPSASELESDFQPFDGDARAIDKEVPWSFIQDQIDSGISQHVADQLSGMGSPFDQPVDALVKATATPELAEKTHARMTDLVIVAAVQWSGFSALNETLGTEGVRSLLGTQLVEPRFTEMTTGASGQSYIDLSVRKAVLEQQSHYLRENASEIQRQLAASQEIAAKTSDETDRQKADLDAVNQKIALDPGNPDLIAERDDLNKKIQRLTAEEKRVEEDREAAEHEHEANDKAQKEADESVKETTDEVASAGKRIFEE